MNMWYPPPPPWYPYPPPNQPNKKSGGKRKPSLKISPGTSYAKALKMIESYEKKVQATIDSRKKKPMQFTFLQTVSMLFVLVPVLGLPYLALLLFIAQLTLNVLQGLVN